MGNRKWRLTKEKMQYKGGGINKRKMINNFIVAIKNIKIV